MAFVTGEIAVSDILALASGICEYWQHKNQARFRQEDGPLYHALKWVTRGTVTVGALQMEISRQDGVVLTRTAYRPEGIRLIDHQDATKGFPRANDARMITAGGFVWVGETSLLNSLR